MNADNMTAGVQRRAAISWGAVFAGLVFTFGMSWLLAVLGVALGVSFSAASDVEAMGQVGLSAAIWVLVSILVVLFLGSLVTARLAGQADSTAGMLHGVTLWSSVLTIMFLLGLLGAVGLFGTGLSLMRTGAVATQGVVSGASTSFQIAQAYWADLVDSPVMNAVQAAIKREATEVLAAQAAADSDVTPGELQRATDRIDDATLRELATALLRGNPERAQSILAARTNLTEAEIESVVRGVQDSVQKLAAEIEPSVLVERIERQFQLQLEQVLVYVSRISGPEVREQELEQVLGQLDAETLAATARYLVLGQPEKAKHVLVVNTSLEEKEIEAIIEGVTRKTEDQIKKAVETVSIYIQAILWTTVLSATLGLLACIVGGRLGAPRPRRA